MHIPVVIIYLYPYETYVIYNVSYNCATYHALHTFFIYWFPMVAYGCLYNAGVRGAPISLFRVGNIHTSYIGCSYFVAGNLSRCMHDLTGKVHTSMYHLFPRKFRILNVQCHKPQHPCLRSPCAAYRVELYTSSHMNYIWCKRNTTYARCNVYSCFPFFFVSVVNPTDITFYCGKVAPICTLGIL